MYDDVSALDWYKLLLLFSRHVHEFDPDAPKIQCKQCGKVFKNEQSKYTHVQTQHENSGKHVCELCGYQVY